jgi:5-formyltetrahydrofolate cyclo-ligase
MPTVHPTLPCLAGLLTGRHLFFELSVTVEIHDLFSEKSRLRSSVRSVLSAVTQPQRLEWSRVITDRVVELPEWVAARTVLAFSSMPEEMDTGPLLESARRDGKRVFLPRIQGDIITFRLTAGDNLDAGPFGILEPVPGAPAWSNDEDGPTIIVCPGLAFDRDFNRLGRGKGYYDRFLGPLVRSQGPPVVTAVAVAYECQVVERVPAGPADVAVDAIVTDKRVMRRETV